VDFQGLAEPGDEQLVIALNGLDPATGEKTESTALVGLLLHAL
jgi:hypothetical protein